MGNCSPVFDQKRCVCGPPFEKPTNPDQGHCFPYRTKIDCEAPVIPTPQCNNTDAYPVYTPGETPPFYVVATLFDQNCLPITDQDDAPILTIIK